MMAAMRCFRDRCDLLAGVRVMPAASKDRVDEQQGCRQNGNKCLHTQRYNLRPYRYPNRRAGQGTLWNTRYKHANLCVWLRQPGEGLVARVEDAPQAFET